MQPELLSKVKEEIDKQLEASLMETVDYPELLANVVVVPKKVEGFGSVLTTGI